MADLNTEAQEAILCEECENRPAQHHCLTCVGHLCGICKDAHERRKITSGHKIIPLTADLPIYGNCVDHNKCKYEVFCNQCDVPICMECMMTEHNGHKIEDIQEAFKRKKQFLLDEIAKIGKIMIPEEEKKLEMKRNELKEMKEATTIIRKKMIEKSEKLIAHIKNLLKSNLEAVDKIDKSEIEDVQSQGKRIEAKISKYENLLFDFEGKLNIRIITDFLLSTRHVIPVYSEESETNSYSLPGFIPSCDENINMQGEFGRIIPPVMQIQQDSFKGKLKLKEKINTNSKTQYGIQINNKSSVWIRNEGIKVRLEKLATKQDIDDITCSIRPSGLCIDDNSVLYSDYENKQLTIVIRTEMGPKGIYVCKSGDILTCLCDSYPKRGKVVKYNKAGRILLQIAEDGKKLKQPAYITENQNLDICVSDTDQKKVVVFDHYGKERFTYDGKSGNAFSSMYPVELDTDSLGNIIVGDEENNCLHIISRDGILLGYLGTKMLTLPRGLSIDSENKIWVAEKDSGQIKVFELPEII